MSAIFILVAILATGIVVGLCVAAILTKPFLDDVDDYVDRAANREASDLLSYLETSECNLFYNPVINSWGLVDGKDTLIAAGSSVKAALRRAQSNDRAELQAAQSSTF
jgi:hypothetical protein